MIDAVLAGEIVCCSIWGSVLSSTGAFLESQPPAGSGNGQDTLTWAKMPKS